VSSPPHFLQQAHSRYGPILEVGIPGRRLISMVEPAYIQQVLVGHNRNYIKDPNTRALKISLGEGLLTSDGDFWRKQRRIAQPAFHRHRLQQLAQNMVKHTREMLQQWEHKPGFNLADEMMVLTSDIAATSLFGASVQNNLEIGRALLTAMRYHIQRFNNPFNLPHWMPTPANRRYQRAMQVLDRSVYGMIEQRRRAGQDGQHDLLAMLMEARDEETGEGMSDKQLRDECITLFAAGHETSANALCWLFYLLDQHPQVQQKVVAEIEAVLGQDEPTAGSIRGLEYTFRTIQEGLRLYPPAWIIGREPLADDHIDGYHIPKGAFVTMCTYVVHRLPQLWESPEAFEPDRFLPEAVKARPKYAYFPFGGGPRLCIGNHFALMEMQIVLAMVLQRFRIRCLPGQPAGMEPLITLRPKGGMQVKLEKRRLQEI